MAQIGGSIESVAIGGRILSVAADGDGALDKGGESNEVQPNGDRTARLIKTTKAWMLESIPVALDEDKDDLGFLQGVANGKNAGPDGYYTIEITLASGRTWNGRGTIVGDVKASTQNATVELGFSGPGELTMQ